MPLTFTLSFCRQVGFSQGGTVSASCQVQVEVDRALPQDHPSALRRQIQSAFNACRQAVSDELGRHIHGGDCIDHSRPAAGVDAPIACRGQCRHAHEGSGCSGPAALRSPTTLDRPATLNQRRAVRAICRDLGITPQVAADNHHFRLSTLGLRHASLLIAQLRELAQRGDIDRYKRLAA